VPIRRRGSQARRQPSRRVALPEPRHAPFEELVERALAALPPAAQRLLENVAIVIDDEPSPEQLAYSESGDGHEGDRDGGDGLYGLYEGTELTAYGADSVAFPNKITLFRLALEADFADPDELALEVQKTVLHEIAHHAGIDDQRLHALGY
jgi:predicted Zn-dependent protease with MMP-like domain